MCHTKVWLKGYGVVLVAWDTSAFRDRTAAGAWQRQLSLATGEPTLVNPLAVPHCVAPCESTWLCLRRKYEAPPTDDDWTADVYVIQALRGSRSMA